MHSPVALAKERLTRSTDVETRGISRRPVGPARPHHPVLWLTSGRTATANPRDARVPTYCAPLGTSRAPSPLRAATTPAQFMLRPVPSSSRGRRRLLNPTFHHLQKTPRSTPTPNQGRVASRAVSQITVAFNKQSCWERAHGKIRDVGREFYWTRPSRANGRANHPGACFQCLRSRRQSQTLPHTGPIRNNSTTTAANVTNTPAILIGFPLHKGTDYEANDPRRRMRESRA